MIKSLKGESLVSGVHRDLLEVVDVLRRARLKELLRPIILRRQAEVEVEGVSISSRQRTYLKQAEWVSDVLFHTPSCREDHLYCSPSSPQHITYRSDTSLLSGSSRAPQMLRSEIQL